MNLLSVRHLLAFMPPDMALCHRDLIPDVLVTGIAALSRGMAMLCVDLMRLLSMQASAAVRSANQGRYREFSTCPTRRLAKYLHSLREVLDARISQHRCNRWTLSLSTFRPPIQPGCGIRYSHSAAACPKRWEALTPLFEWWIPCVRKSYTLILKLALRH